MIIIDQTLSLIKLFVLVKLCRRMLKGRETKIVRVKFNGLRDC